MPKNVGLGLSCQKINITDIYTFIVLLLSSPLSKPDQVINPTERIKPIFIKIRYITIKESSKGNCDVSFLYSCKSGWCLPESLIFNFCLSVYMICFTPHCLDTYFYQGHILYFLHQPFLLELKTAGIERGSLILQYTHSKNSVKMLAFRDNCSKAIQ